MRDAKNVIVLPIQNSTEQDSMWSSVAAMPRGANAYPMFDVFLYKSAKCPLTAIIHIHLGC